MYPYWFSNVSVRSPFYSQHDIVIFFFSYSTLYIVLRTPKTFPIWENIFIDFVWKIYERQNEKYISFIKTRNISFLFHGVYGMPNDWQYLKILLSGTVSSTAQCSKIYFQNNIKKIQSKKAPNFSYSLIRSLEGLYFNQNQVPKRIIFISESL